MKSIMQCFHLIMPFPMSYDRWFIKKCFLKLRGFYISSPLAQFHVARYCIYKC